MSVLIDISYAGEGIDEARIRQTAEFALEQAGAPKPSDVSITFVDDDEMADLNERYRGKADPTDVLSFECDNAEDDFPNAPEGDAYELGDIVIAPDVASRQAKEFGNAYEDELDMLVVHGVLHLLGFDHIDDADAAVMEPKQRDILVGLAQLREA